MEMSKLERLAQEKYRHTVNSLEDDVNARVNGNNTIGKKEKNGNIGKSNIFDKKENNGNIVNKVKSFKVLLKKMTPEEAKQFKNEAVARERAKRRKERKLDVDENKINIYLKDKQEAIRREKKKKKSVVSINKKENSMKKYVVKTDRNKLLEYKEEAKRREMKKERLRRKQQLLSNNNNETKSDDNNKTNISTSSTDYSKYKQLAIEREEKRNRLQAKAVAREGKISSLRELEELFYSQSNESGVLSLNMAVRLVARCTMCSLDLSRLRGVKLLSWTTLLENLTKVDEATNPNKKDGKQSKKEMERKIKSIISLCHTSFLELERHSDVKGKVRPSDLNALHSTEFNNEEFGFVGFPIFETKRDHHVLWIEYRDWLYDVLVKNSKKFHVIHSPAFEKQIKVREEEPKKQKKWGAPKEHVHVVSVSDDKITNTNHHVDNNKKHNTNTPGDVRLVDDKIKDLEARLNQIQQEEKKNHDNDASSSCSSSSSLSSYTDTNNNNDFSGNKSSVESDDDDDEIDSELYSGRCWMLCERENNDWFEEKQEWIRCPEVCTEVQVTQIRNPFRMYINVHILRSGLRCMRRIGIDELTMLTGHCAQQEASMQSKLELSKSGMHVFVGGKKNRHRCKLLGPEEWGKEEIQAAIQAEEEMKQWVENGKIPKQNNLVQWVLLHATIRISGDEMDSKDGHIDLILPGENKTVFDEEDGKTRTILGDEDTGRPLNKIQQLQENDNTIFREICLILNKQKYQLEDVQDWFLEKKRSGLVRLFGKICSPSLLRSDIKKAIEMKKSTRDFLYSLVDKSLLHDEWKLHTKNLRVADVYDAFRTNDDDDNNNGVSCETFVSLLQDTFLLKIPEWQLAIWHYRFPNYRDFVKYLYK